MKQTDAGVERHAGWIELAGVAAAGIHQRIAQGSRGLALGLDCLALGMAWWLLRFRSGHCNEAPQTSPPQPGHLSGWAYDQ
jgi:hypothetical protein